MPTRSSSSSPSSSDSGAGLAGGGAHHLLHVDPGRAGPQRQVIARDLTALRFSPAPALPAAGGSPAAARRAPVLPAAGSRAVPRAGRAAPDEAPKARSPPAARVFCGPAGSTFSLVTVQASICPISRRRTTIWPAGVTASIPVSDRAKFAISTNASIALSGLHIDVRRATTGLASHANRANRRAGRHEVQRYRFRIAWRSAIVMDQSDRNFSSLAGHRRDDLSGHAKIHRHRRPPERKMVVSFSRPSTPDNGATRIV